MVKLCKYRFIVGAKKGQPCEKVIRTESDYCHLHKQHGDEMASKYKEKYESIDRKQNAYKSEYIKQIDDIDSDEEVYNRHKPKPKKQKIEDDDVDQLLLNNFIKKKKAQIQTKKAVDVESMDAETLYSLLETEVVKKPLNKVLIKSIAIKLHGIDEISDDEVKGLLKKYC